MIKMIMSSIKGNGGGGVVSSSTSTIWRTVFGSAALSSENPEEEEEDEITKPGGKTYMSTNKIRWVEPISDLSFSLAVDFFVG